MELKRLAHAEELMYGNKDESKSFLIDTKTRLTHYVIYKIKGIKHEMANDIIHLDSTAKFFQPTIADWENIFDEGRFFERRMKGFTIVILHDPKLQAQIEETELKSGKTANVSELRTKIGKAKSADEFAPKKSTKAASKEGGVSK